MRILAIDFSSSDRNAAVRVQGRTGSSVFHRSQAGETRTRPVALASAVLAQAGLVPADITQLAVGLGPGSYAGLRLSLAFAQGWQLAHDTPIAGISSAEIMAWQLQGAGRRGQVGIAVHAQRNEYCLGLFELTDKEVRPADRLHLISQEALAARISGGLPVAGPDLGGPLPGAMDCTPDTRVLARRAETIEGTARGETLTPIYVREAFFVKAPPPRRDR